MCGIFGIIGSKSSFSDKCLDSLKHRGPDDSGKFEDDSVILGFRRLSIVDLSHRGHQPMSNEKKNIWLVFNGEIYNYKDLRQELSKKHQFLSNTDTETLIHGYEEWGIDGLLSRLNGMFAICLYDQKKKKAYLVRDEIGKKPLYYFRSQGYISFSSEVKAFFHLKDFNFKINQEKFELWMGFPFLPDNEETLLENVHKVPPFHYLEVAVETGKTSIKSYKKLVDYRLKNNVSFVDQAEKLEVLLSDSVKKRLEADVPVGVLLSGGLDSSLITALAAKHSKTQIQTINISFSDTVIDESRFAKLVSKHCQTKHLQLNIPVKDIYTNLKKHIDIYDDLGTADGGLFSTYLLSQKIRQSGIKVILVGEGADEIFGGYTWFQLSLSPLKFLGNFVQAFLYHYAIMRTLPPNTRFRHLRFLVSRLSEYPRTVFKKIQNFEIKYSLPNHYCMKVDKGSSAASTEARAPYMDYRIVEMARSLPDRSFFGTDWVFRAPKEKHILRQIAKKYLPQEILSRKKKGGMLPIYDLLDQGIRKDSRLIMGNPLLIGYWGEDKLQKLIESRPKYNLFRWQREWILWKCLLFSLWYKHFSTYGK